VVLLARLGSGREAERVGGIDVRRDPFEPAVEVAADREEAPPVAPARRATLDDGFDRSEVARQRAIGVRPGAAELRAVLGRRLGAR
jgi:hypothetical protein